MGEWPERMERFSPVEVEGRGYAKFQSSRSTTALKREVRPDD